jgi:hypothetical protein
MILTGAVVEENCVLYHTPGMKEKYFSLNIFCRNKNSVNFASH